MAASYCLARSLRGLLSSTEELTILFIASKSNEFCIPTCLGCADLQHGKTQRQPGLIFENPAGTDRTYNGNNRNMRVFCQKYIHRRSRMCNLSRERLQAILAQPGLLVGNDCLRMRVMIEPFPSNDCNASRKLFNPIELLGNIRLEMPSTVIPEYAAGRFELVLEL